MLCKNIFLIRTNFLLLAYNISGNYVERHKKTTFEIMQLYNFQTRAIDFALEKQRCLLNLDTGLGKTRVALEVIRTLAEANPQRRLKAMVIVPANLTATWGVQADLWYPASECIRLKNGSTITVRDKRAAEIRVFNYEVFSRKAYSAAAFEHLKNYQPDIVICDESHRLKNWEAMTTRRVVFEWALKAQYFICLTATPYINSAADYHPTFSAIQPGKWGKYEAFAKEYCHVKPDPWRRDKDKYSGVKNEAQLVERMREFVLRITQEEAQVELPRKVNTNLYVDIGRVPTNAQALLDAIEAAGDTEFQPEETFNKEWHDLGVAKVKHVVEWVKDNVHANPHMLIFGWHLDVLEAIADQLSCPIITGETPMRTRERIVMDFQSGRYRSPIVLSQAVGGEGLNLQRANTVVHAELPLTDYRMRQCDGRVARLGQSEDTVFSNRFIALNSLDEIILRMVHSKADGADRTIGAL